MIYNHFILFCHFISFLSIAHPLRINFCFSNQVLAQSPNQLRLNVTINISFLCDKHIGDVSYADKDFFIV